MDAGRRLIAERGEELSLDPDGMAPRIVNLSEWRAHLLGRLRRQVALTADPGLAALYEELRRRLAWQLSGLAYR